MAMGDPELGIPHRPNHTPRRVEGEEMPSGPVAKRSCDKGGAAGDRLSALPDDLLHDILSFLPAREVVRTSVLSRRWRGLWSSTPFIDIDELAFEEAGILTKERWDRFENFTNNLLLFHCNAVSLYKFRLRAPHPPPFTTTVPSMDQIKQCQQLVDRWIRHGIKYCPQVLELDLPFLASGVYLITLPHLGSSIARLRKLNLSCVTLDNRFRELLCCEMSVLEDLELECCRILFQDITSPTLKKLVIDDCSHQATLPVGIHTPDLASLHLIMASKCYEAGIVCKMASLVKATIEVDVLLCDSFPERNLRRLLGSLFNVTSLELRRFNTMAFLKETDEFPVFPVMRTLSLDHCFLDNYNLDDKLEALGSFLQNTPCLERLTLDCCLVERDMFNEDYEEDWDITRKSIILHPHVLKPFRCGKLKLIEVFYDDDHDYRLIELLWCLGRVLPDATIRLTMH